ncbi:MAG: DNA-processing protein DprA [Paludibacteraceae bacterium]|nr:DNA-processing protein DprA [Paludibacteraceae bacterium]
MLTDDKQIKMRLALANCKGIGFVHASELVSRFGSVEGVFAAGVSGLRAAGLSAAIAESLFSENNWAFAEKEFSFVRRNGIRVYFCTDDDYPFRLKECVDAPVILYYKGSCPIDCAKTLGIVGTRKATEEGIRFVNQFLEELAKTNPDVLIVSGLAYGIDICAHRAALKNGLNTIAVMATGMSVVYPSSHRGDASKIKDQGGVLTEYYSDFKLNKNGFAARNRIVAGLCDAVLVVESPIKGGSLITASIANSYNRDVFAVPGRPVDESFAGCNRLIMQNKAAMVCSANDLSAAMGWNVSKEETLDVGPKEVEELTSEEKIVISIIRQYGKVHIDDMAQEAKLPVQTLKSLLFMMEMKGLVHPLPGNMYAIGKY